ncbi:hypothetical protein MXEN_10189 [Mycobacterium xenopi RIVM700367]|nr:hypothetical protein MXEN_10189 [Mycobacterium xenopi RIVM700367]
MVAIAVAEVARRVIGRRLIRGAATRDLLFRTRAVTITADIRSTRAMGRWWFWWLHPAGMRVWNRLMRR